MKRISVWILGMMIAAAVMFAACGGGGGGGGNNGPDLQPPTYNFSGTWIVTEKTGSNTSGDPVGVKSGYLATVAHAEGSNSLTMTNNSNGESFTATVSGSSVTYSGTGYDPSCSSLSLSMNFTASSATSMSGTISWVCYYAGGSCSGTDSVTATKAVNEIESNDIPSSAQALTIPSMVNGSTSGSCSTTCDYDLYKITPPTGESYTITLTFDNSADMGLYLYNSSYITLLSYSDEIKMGGSETITWYLSAGSTYYITVTPWVTSGTESYTLTVQ